MSEMDIVEYNNIRVLTTKQLAEAYGTKSQQLTNNFNNNRNRYEEGKHYIQLEGKEKNEFLNLTKICVGSKNAKVLYLWTEKGALLHAKSLNTDTAWEIYDRLVDNYFRSKEQMQQLSAPQEVPAVLQQFMERQQSLMEAISDRLAALEARREEPLGITVSPGSKPFTVAENESAARKRNLNRLVSQMAKACGWTKNFALHRLYKTKVALGVGIVPIMGNM